MWWLTLSRLISGMVGLGCALRALRHLRDAKVIREFMGRNGMELHVLRVLIFCVSVIALGLFLTALNSAVVLPAIATRAPYGTRQVVGAVILTTWAVLSSIAAAVLMALLPRLGRMAKEQESVR